MSTKTFSFPKLSKKLITFCETSDDPLVRTAPQQISEFLRVDENLPRQYGWRYSDLEAIRRQTSSAKNNGEINRIYWTDQARNVEAYTLMTMWRGAELMKPAIRSLNLEEVITPAVLARSLLELSTAYLLHANTIDKLFENLRFPPRTVVVSEDFEARVVKMIWGTRLGDPEPDVEQMNIMTMLQRLAKNPNAAELLPHYEFLCEVAHPNVIGNTRFWSHVERTNDDGTQTLLLSRISTGNAASEIQRKVIWSLAWSAGALRNSHALVFNALNSLVAKLESRA